MKARVGIYSVGLETYWSQFAGFFERVQFYNKFIAEKMSTTGAEVYNFGVVDSEAKARACGEYFNAQNVDIIFLHCATYATSAAIVPVHKICKAKTILLNLQPCRHVAYETTTTGEWLAHCNACVVPEICNAFNRCGLQYEVISGLLGLPETPKISLTDENTENSPEAIRAWKEIGQWIAAAGAVRTLQNTRFGFLGNTYSGMLDMYSDFTMLTGQLGLHVEVLEMCDLKSCYDTVTDGDVRGMTDKIRDFFRITGDSPSEPLARKPSAEQLEWSAKVAAAQEKLVKKFNLGALAYYYHGAEGTEYETLQKGFIVGFSLLTAAGVPCAGEGDLKTAIAMKICDTLGVGGSFCEIVTTDYDDGTILLGHDGPFHIQIAEGKPILREMGLYHGKRGAGISVEAKVRRGDVTNLGLTQTGDGKLKLIISEGVSTDGKIMTIGNTQTPVRFPTDPDTYMETWFAEAPTHHFAMSVGKNAALFEKVAKLLDVQYIVLS